MNKLLFSTPYLLINKTNNVFEDVFFTLHVILTSVNLLVWMKKLLGLNEKLHGLNEKLRGLNEKHHG